MCPFKPTVKADRKTQIKLCRADQSLLSASSSLIKSAPVHRPVCFCFPVAHQKVLFLSCAHFHIQQKTFMCQCRWQQPDQIHVKQCINPTALRIWQHDISINERLSKVDPGILIRDFSVSVGLLWTRGKTGILYHTVQTDLYLHW